LNVRRFAFFGSLILLPGLILTGCLGFSGPPNVGPIQPGVVSLNPQSWYILYGDGMPDQPSPSSTGAWSMAFPNVPGSVHYVQTPYNAASSLPNEVSITFRIESSKDAIYNGEVDPAAGNPATFHLFLERRGDNFTNEYYRWWADEGGYVLGSKDNSVVTIRVPLTADSWSSVYGQHNSAEFADALNNLGWVGMTFGGANYSGHGVNLLAGTAKFTLLDFRVNRVDETQLPASSSVRGASNCCNTLFGAAFLEGRS
jgi:hypothetical protein